MSIDDGFTKLSSRVVATDAGITSESGLNVVDSESMDCGQLECVRGGSLEACVSQLNGRSRSFGVWKLGCARHCSALESIRMGLMGTVALSAALLAAIHQVKAIKLPSTASIRLPARPPCFLPSDTDLQDPQTPAPSVGAVPTFSLDDVDQQLRARGAGRRSRTPARPRGLLAGMRTNCCGGGITTVLTADAMTRGCHRLPLDCRGSARACVDQEVLDRKIMANVPTTHHTPKLGNCLAGTNIGSKGGHPVPHAPAYDFAIKSTSNSSGAHSYTNVPIRCILCQVSTGNTNDRCLQISRSWPHQRTGSSDHSPLGVDREP
ncbi:hypothetical protein B0H14DRAFT_3161356 [Mycena olivaceomarginata]|nr:hypothetical protein B0H14DRAFT_3161356 [Mycena olivaceomarginata]